ncbi:hypothetical protein CMT48_17185 [Elizabethkingia anophelis]|nr:hypothetical protein [Elizabethkingia anophelis]
MENKTKLYSKEQIRLGFEKWAKDYAENPEKFDDVSSVKDASWAEESTEYFIELIEESEEDAK